MNKFLMLIQQPMLGQRVLKEFTFTAAAKGTTTRPRYDYNYERRNRRTRPEMEIYDGPPMGMVNTILRLQYPMIVLAIIHS